MNDNIILAIDLAGTMAFAISGIRLAARKNFDLFGAYVVGLVTAIGGGTIRDLLLDCTPIWMLQPIYIITTALSLLLLILLGRHLLHFMKTFFIFDTIGLALFTIVGAEKSLAAGFAPWVVVIMGIITGAFGGVMRDMMIGEVPLIFRRDIYALASLLGGVLFVVLNHMGVDEVICYISAALTIVTIRIVAVQYHIHLPRLVESDKDNSSRIRVDYKK